MKVMAEEDDPNENVSRPKDEIAPITSHNNHRNEKKRKGMKPRSKRNRKRAKGGGVVQHSSNNNNKNRLDPNANVENEVEVQVVPLFWNQKDRRERVRIVKPYFFTFATFVKGRWEGRTVLDVYSSEFGSYPKSYYELAIQSGRILVNSKRVKPDHILRGGNEITHTVHRHEPAIAVSDTPDDDSYNEQNKQHESYMQNLIPVIHEDDDIIVVDKPSSIPIHPCGNYNFNSMFHILSTQNQTKKKLYTIHRLDRLTSGLVICAKSSKVAQDLGKCIMDRTCQKIYLARVRGKFPLNVHFQSLQYLCGEKEGELPSISFGEIISNISDHQNEKSNVIQDISDKSNQKQQRKREVHVSKCAIGYFVTNAANQIIPNSKSALENMFLECSSRTNLDHDQSLSSFQPFTLNLACPCRISSPKNGICEAGSFSHSTPYVKPAQTSFTPLLYDADSDTTIVQCRPITGRTHQIRLHLQFLGHPIANDPNYGGELWFADLEGKNACKCAEERMKEMDQRSGQCGHINEKEGDHDSAEKPEGAITTDIPASEKEILSAEKAAAESLNSTQNNIDLCENVDENKLYYEYLRKSCVWCRRSMGEERDNERITSEFMVRSPGIWLHALKYTFYENGIQQVSYNTKVPEWANPKRG